MKSSKRWQEVKEILYPALEMAADERSSFLDEKCGNDDQLRAEIESLVAAHGQVGARFELPAMEAIAADAQQRPNDTQTCSCGWECRVDRSILSLISLSVSPTRASSPIET